MAKDPQVGAIMKSLSFEVEASPHDNIIQLTSSANSTPVNVKIKVRKKKDVDAQHAIVSIPKYGRPGAGKERIRLVSSDQTILSFKMYLENVAEEKLMKKHGKSFFGKFKPGGCLDPNRDEDDAPYSPPIKTIANVTRSISDHSLTTKPTIITDNPQPDLKQAKNEDVVHLWKKRGAVAKDDIQTKKSADKIFLGKCKPGGCLDPPFGEDRYAYKPQEALRIATDSSIAVQKQEENTNTESTLNKVELSKKKKSRTDDKKDSDSIVSEFESERLKQVPSNSHSIITYPPTSTSSDQKLFERHGSKEQCKRTSVVYRKSFTGSTENYFYPKSGTTSVVSRNKLKTHDRPDTKDLQSKTQNKVTADNEKNYIDEQFKSNTPIIIKISADEEPQVSSQGELKNPVMKTHLKTNKEVEPPDDYENLQRNSINKLIAQHETINNDISKDPPILTIINLEISDGVQNTKRTSKTETDKISLNSIYKDERKKKDNLQVERKHVAEVPDIIMPVADVITVENRKLSKPSSGGSPNRSLGGIRRKSLTPIVPVTVPKSARAPSTVTGNNSVEGKMIASAIPANNRGKDNVKPPLISKTKDGNNTKTLNTSPISRRSTYSNNKVVKNKLESLESEMVAETPQRISKTSSGKYYPANGRLTSGSPKTSRAKNGSKDLKSIDVTARDFMPERKDTIPKKDRITCNTNIGKEKVKSFAKGADKYRSYPIESSTTKPEDEEGFTQNSINGPIVDILRRKETQSIDVTLASNEFRQGKRDTSPIKEVNITNHANMGQDRTKTSYNEIRINQSYPINSSNTKTEDKELLKQPTAKEINTNYTTETIEDMLKQENGKSRELTPGFPNQSLTTGKENSKIKERISTKRELKETIMTYDLERTQSPLGTNIRYSLNLKNGDTPFNFNTEISNKKLLSRTDPELISNNLTQTLDLTTTTDTKQNNSAIEILSDLDLKASGHNVLREKINLSNNKVDSISISKQRKKDSTTIPEKQPTNKNNIKRSAYTVKAPNDIHNTIKLSSENTDSKFAKSSDDKPLQSVINYEVADNIAVLQKPGSNKTTHEIRVPDEPLHYIRRESLKSLTIENPQITEPSLSMEIINKTTNDFKQHDTLQLDNTNSFQKIIPNSGMVQTGDSNLQFANNLPADKLSFNIVRLPELLQNNTIENKNEEYPGPHEQDKPILLSKKSDVTLSIDKKETSCIRDESKKLHEDLFKDPVSVDVHDNDNNNEMNPEIDNNKSLSHQAYSGQVHREDKVNNMRPPPPLIPLPDSQNINKYGTQNFNKRIESLSSADNKTTLNYIDETEKPTFHSKENFHSKRDTFELRQSHNNSNEQTRGSDRVFNLFDILSSATSARPSSEQKGETNINFTNIPLDEPKRQKNTDSTLITFQEDNDVANVITLKLSQPHASSDTYFNKNNFKRGVASDTGSKATDRYEQDIVDPVEIIQDNLKSQKTYNSDLDQYAPQKVTISIQEDMAKYSKACENGQEETNVIQSKSSDEALLLKTKNYEHRVSSKSDSFSYSHSRNDNDMKTTSSIMQHIKPIPLNKVGDKQESYKFKNAQNEAQITLTTDTNEDDEQKTSSNVTNYPSSNERFYRIQSGDEKEEIKYPSNTSSISLETTVRQVSKIKLNENDDVHENISLKDISNPSTVQISVDQRLHSDNQTEEIKYPYIPSSTRPEISLRQISNIESNENEDVDEKLSSKDIRYLATIESQTLNYAETKEIKSPKTSSDISRETPVKQVSYQETKVGKSTGNDDDDDKIFANDTNYRFSAESSNRKQRHNDLKEIKYPKTPSVISQETPAEQVRNKHFNGVEVEEESTKEINSPPRNENDRIRHYDKIDQIKYPESSSVMDRDAAMEQVRKIKTTENQNDDEKISSKDVNYPVESSDDVEEIKHSETASAIRRETPLGQVWYRKVNGNENDDEKLSFKDINYFSPIKSPDLMRSYDKTNETKYSQDAPSTSREASGQKEGLDTKSSPISSIMSMQKFESKHTVSFHDRQQDIIEIPEIPVQEVVMMDLAFKHHLKEGNESVLKSHFPGAVSDVATGAKIVSFKGKVERDMDIKIPIDSQYSLKVQITKSSQTGQDSVTQGSRRKMPELQRTSYENIGRELDTVLSSLYIQHLLPLQNIIVSLKQDVDSLVSQQDLVNQLVLKRKRSARVRAVKKCYCPRNIT